jgi:hypothetical protein
MAHEIMGKYFFGVEDAVQYFGIKPGKAQLSALEEVPFTAAQLREVRDTHVLVAVFPISILEIRARVKRRLFCRHEDAWYNDQAFAKDEGKASWQLVRKTPVANSLSKDWQKQQAFIGKKDEVPSAQVVIYTIIGHQLSTRERLFEKVYVRSSSVDSDGGRVVVGRFDSMGLDVDGYWDGYLRCDLGVSSARKV